MARTRVLVPVIIIGILVVSLGFYLLSEKTTFDTGGRYDPTSFVNMTTPYVNSSDVNTICQAYSNTADCPWGFIHRGIDFSNKNLTQFQAVCPGKIISIEHGLNQPYNMHRINVKLQYNNSLIVEYIFESWSNLSSVYSLQFSLIEVSVGDWVNRSDPIGKLLVMGDGAHVDFGIWIGENRVCPAPFFSPAALQNLTDLLHSFHPTWNLFYCV